MGKLTKELAKLRAYVTGEHRAFTMLLMGSGLAAYGTSLIYMPAGWIIGGGALAAIAVLFVDAEAP
jgi:uncharacterized membrane protein AbrB (regulator of aidB expression)